MGVGFGAKQYPRPPSSEVTNGCRYLKDVFVMNRGIAAGNITATYQAGTIVPVTWETTLVHPNPPGEAL